MRRNKPGLADLKKLRQQAQAPEPPAPARNRSRARKRAPFLPPSSPQPESAARHPEQKRSAAPAPGPSAASAAGLQRPAGAAEPGTLLSDTDRRLFRSAVRHVERIKDPGRVLLAPVAAGPPSILRERRMRAAGLESRKTLEPLPPQRERKPRALSDEYAPATGDDSLYLKSGHGTDVLKHLRRGKWPIGASLDLHGSTLEDARERFERFLASCLAHDIKCVRIVHGKGHGSPDGDAVLKTTLRRWLTQLDEVVAYTECAEADGGSGAVQVLLKVARKEPDD